MSNFPRSMPRLAADKLLSKPDLAAAAIVTTIPFLVAGAAALSRGWRPPGDTGFWGAVIGAIVGGAIALAGQWLTILDARKHRRDEQAAQNRAHGTAFLLKLVQVYNDFHNVDRFFREAFDNERARSPGVEPWQVYRPASSYPDAVHFATEEMVVLVSRAPAKLTERCVGLDNKHNALLAGIARLDGLRTAFVATLQPDGVDGHVVSGYVEFGPRQRSEMNIINSLLEGFRASCVEDLTEARQALIEVNELFRRELSMTISVSPQ